MIDLYLRAADEAELIAALPFARGEDEEGNPLWLAAGDGWALDLIGPLVIDAGSYGEDGEEIEPPVIDGRYHANLRTTSAELAASVPEGVIVTPEPGTPVRVWAGDEQAAPE